MRFKDRHPDSRIPQVNLVPMMDVLMTVLTFFIIISMTLTGRQLLDINLPRSSTNPDSQQQSAKPREQPIPLIVGLNLQGELILDSQPASLEQLSQRLQEHFTQHPNGILVLKADRELPYESVAQMLEILRDIGGDRVSLAVE
ncbi:MAG: biopolymer transporter ExbD [Leptolyngbyaceae cyanobacterium MO_188.B28]|nr:biopolymer transporter ExbD [Leptolyngbyaceae cyanobacterium MO_188.B28]